MCVTCRWTPSGVWLWGSCSIIPGCWKTTTARLSGTAGSRYSHIFPVFRFTYCEIAKQHTCWRNMLYMLKCWFWSFVPQIIFVHVKSETSDGCNLSCFWFICSWATLTRTASLRWLFAWRDRGRAPQRWCKRWVHLFPRNSGSVCFLFSFT